MPFRNPRGEGLRYDYTTSITNVMIVALWRLILTAHWTPRSIHCANPKVSNRESRIRWMEGSFYDELDNQEVIGNTMRVILDCRSPGEPLCSKSCV